MTRNHQHWARMGEHTFVGGIWMLFWVHRLFGRWPFRLCMYPAVLLHWVSRPALRASSLQYLRRLQAARNAFGRPVRLRDSFIHVATFAETMLDKLLATSGRYRFAGVRREGGEIMDQAIANGGGGVIITAHMGCLELCRAMAERNRGLRLNVLVHTRHAAQFNRILERLNPAQTLNLIEVTEISPATAILLSERVAAGEFVVIAGDRIPVSNSQTVEVDFLGYPAQLPIGPYVMASLLKCPLYLLGCIHAGTGYTLHFELLAAQVKLPRQDRAGAARMLAQSYVQAVTRLLALAPYDWFNFFPFWDQSHAKHTH